MQRGLHLLGWATVLGPAAALHNLTCSWSSRRLGLWAVTALAATACTALSGWAGRRLWRRAGGAATAVRQDPDAAAGGGLDGEEEATWRDEAGQFRQRDAETPDRMRAPPDTDAARNWT